MRLNIERSILLALALALLLSACLQPPPPEATEPGGQDTGEATAPVETLPPAQVPQEGSSRADSLFSVNYDSSASMNPLTGTNLYNEQLFSLLFEGLFALSPDLKPEKVLCESFTVTDGLLYHIELKAGVLFHDGTPLTPGDVVSTLRAAARSSKYAQRLADLESVTVSGDTGVDIRLKRANYLLPALLDIPILKAGAGDDADPVGTGPYMRSGQLLTAFPSHRDYREDSLRTIYLKEISAPALTEAFLERIIDLVDYDPTGSDVLNIHMVHESRYYDTSQLLYLGFNTSAPVVSDVLARRALMRLVDRESISGEIYSGAARPSPFILSPALELYDSAQTAGYGFSRQDYQRLAVSAGLEDTDEDGYVEYNGSAFTLTLLVNSDSPRRVEAAERIAADMENVGLRVEVASLPYNQYVNALKAGDFHMYLGEVRLRADLDLTALFSGSLNYSKLQDAQYGVLMDAYLGSDESARRQAAYDLDIYVAEDAAIVPILYKQRAVVTHVGVVAGARPSQSGPFLGALSWTFDLD